MRLSPLLIALCLAAAGCGETKIIPEPRDCETIDVQIFGNHGHLLPITLAEIDAAQPIVFDITGEADHTHVVTLTGPQLGQIRDYFPVQVTSSPGQGAVFGEHTHQVLLRCSF